jgi:uncharacterized delta-60 repeat protein
MLRAWADRKNRSSASPPPSSSPEPASFSVEPLEGRVLLSVVNLAEDKPAVATTEYDATGTYAAGKVTDGESFTRWASQIEPDNQAHVIVDLLGHYDIRRVHLTWDGSFASSYQIKVSDVADVSTFQTVHSNTSNSTLENDFAVSTRARYVMVNCLASPGGNWLYSLCELRVYSVPNLALNAPAAASSTYDSSIDQWVAGKATDGVHTTRWASHLDQAGGTVWLRADLGAAKDIARVQLRWEAAYANSFKVQATDTPDVDESWRTLYETTTNGSLLNDLSVVPDRARFVRVLCLQSPEDWVYSIFDFEVYGPLSAPEAPATLDTAGVSTSQINLAWPRAAGATRYRIDRAAYNTTNWTELATVTAASDSTVSYSDTGMTAGTRYHYRVVAKNDAGEAAARQADGATRHTTPTTLNADAISATEVRLTWTASPDASGYKVERALASEQNPTWTILVPQHTATTYDDVFASPATSYLYQVTATGAATASLAIQKLIDTPLAPPQRVRAYTPASAPWIGVTWQDVPGASFYVVERMTSGGSWTQIAQAIGTSVYDQTIVVGTSYSYRVTAKAGTITSPASAVATATATDPGAILGLDRSFGGGGVVHVRDVMSTHGIFFREVAVQPDAKTVLSGGEAGHVAVARYNVDGSVDAVFGTAGTARIATAGIAYIYALALQPDGKIIAAGEVTPDGAQPAPDADTSFLLARFNADGSPDNSFGVGGLAKTNFGTMEDRVEAVAVQSDGKIWAAGNSQWRRTQDGGWGTHVAMARYSANGSLDTTFDGDGKRTHPFSDACSGNTLALQHDGRLVMVATGKIIRFLPDGAFDPGFGGGDGIVDFDGGEGVGVLTDGRIVVKTGNGIQRYNQDGTPDVQYQQVPGGSFWNIAALPDNSVIGVRTTHGIDPDDDTEVIRWNADGQLVAGEGGRLKFDMTGQRIDDLPFALAVGDNGKIVIAGQLQPPDDPFESGVIARLNGTAQGSGWLTFLDNEWRSINPDYYFTRALNVSNAVTTEGLPLLAGFNENTPDNDNFRIEVNDPSAAAMASVNVTLTVIRLGYEVYSYTYDLDKRNLANPLDASKFRGEYLRLVADEDDDAASGAGASDPKHQTILVELDDVIRITYTRPSGEKWETLQRVGMPATSGAGDNAADQLKHDIRELKLNVVVFQRALGSEPVFAKHEVEQLLAQADRRLAQATVRIRYVLNVGPDGNGVALSGAGAHLLDGFTPKRDAILSDVNEPTDDEKAIVTFKDADPNTIDVFFVEHIVHETGIGVAYTASRNNMKNLDGTPNTAYQNFIVIERLVAEEDKQRTLAHEVMHVLLNRGHRDSSEPADSLFYRSSATDSNGRLRAKRIGPFALPGGFMSEDDTRMIRDKAEVLPL